MPDNVQHDAAKAAAYVAWELFESSPGAPEAAIIAKLEEIIVLAIQETERQAQEERPFTCPYCLHSRLIHQALHDTPGRCPKCQRMMLTPDQVRSN